MAKSFYARQFDFFIYLHCCYFALAGKRHLVDAEHDFVLDPAFQPLRQQMKHLVLLMKSKTRYAIELESWTPSVFTRSSLPSRR